MKSRKTVSMKLTVTVPKNMPAADARREVRSLINDLRNYYADPGDVKVKAIKPTSLLDEG